MFRTFLFFLTFWISLIISLLWLIPLLIFNLSGARESRKRYIKSLTAKWSEFMLFIAGIKINCNKLCPFPSSAFVIVANHQGYFDIPVLLSVLPISPAFISKKELQKIPLLNLWMNAMDCLFIDRSDSTGSRKKIMLRLREKDLNPLLLFPEGTRSRGSKMGKLRTGGLKMVFDSGIDVMPVKIRNTYRSWEEKRRIVPGKVSIDIMPAIKTNDYKNSGFNSFINDIEKILTNVNE